MNQGLNHPSRKHDADGEATRAAPRGGSLSERARAQAAPVAYLAGLNHEQRLAVETTEGPVLVLAGAGTGKTRVLTTRIAHLIAIGRARPSDILAVTFTNKAAREMKARVGMLVGPAAEGMPWLGTFHAISTKILRRHAELVGLKSDFTILDVDDQIRLMKQVIQAANLDEKRWPARQLASIIDGWKNRALGPDQVPHGEGAAFANGRGTELYRHYQERLKILNAADFGDLLTETIRLFREHPDVLAQYQKRFRYMLVDEYQDTNVAQYLWLRLLAQGREPGQRNLACVGDDDQSIYGWRGAEVDNILRFEHDFPGAVVVRLERNYRSHAHILAAASHLIAHNEGRLGKTLRTDDEPGEKVTITGAWDSEEEARLVGEEIEALQAKGHNLSEIAILVRISAQMRELEDRFVQLGLPYRVIGGPRFYERMEIRDALAYFRCVAQPADDLAFERILNTPKRGLGDATVQVLHAHARAARIPLMEAARFIVETEELKPKPRGSLRDLLAAFSRWSSLIDNTPQTELAEMILEESGYTEMWQKDRSAEAAGRLENLKELVRSLEEFPDLRGFLEHVSLVMDAVENDTEDRVSLMTLHAAKGLEFDTVFLPGWEEGLFPNQRALDESGRAGLEEERRLAHVGITRARRRAKIYFASNRRIHGLWNATIPSRFIDELPEDHVEVTEAPAAFSYGGYGKSRFDDVESFSSSYATPGWQRAQNKGGLGSGGFGGGGSRGGFAQGRGGYGGSSGPGRGGLLIEGELVAKSSGPASAFAPSDRVFHIKFGPGSVAAVDGNKLTVDFDKAGRKMVLDSFVQRQG
ncbi:MULTISPECIES: UvrD-helicase domain-containing protein [unclassified Chelatococcus]|uniref:ATP-dependent helicase n=1 Tax=unclassified Chelatococcus TaxID=2638111 RepID=UPI001BD09596|nr:MULTISPECIES: UvrD-helicase domain-containing protein [unclassified Chelatococcus]CAH1666602.1 ATP-dependent DNA helicase UvrD/PcrA [Hyphomicrobiales bacterium]MBS7737875.1 UvrD-helicase domain-containing protein [Chelatococcus sp. HY11]MBX3546677.1 UvrD-helicase domain-containing protein [Chelatococcus sp.]MCO5079329.1 UvrD-helicase domain-containing protein [Chelatococcus sp.]CAH1680446.1 ATP-dependent DNA helicase UvrD/PcrA [Hyphomicrobiales bacterium]